jgi:hypothetical protein
MSERKKELKVLKCATLSIAPQMGADFNSFIGDLDFVPSDHAILVEVLFN